jgi:hypothetical protein
MSFFKNLMEIFGKSDTKGDGSQLSQEARQLFDAYMEECQTINSLSLQDAEIEAAKKISDAAETLQIECLIESVRRNLERTNYADHLSLQHLSQTLMKQSLPLTEEDILRLFALATSNTESPWYSRPFGSLIGVAERHVKTNGLSEDMRTALQIVVEQSKPVSPNAETKKLLKRYHWLIHSDHEDGAPLEINRFEAWGAKAIADIKALPKDQQSNWKHLLEHATKCSGSAPTKKWLESSKPFIDKVGKESFVDFVDSCFSLIGTKGTHPNADAEHMYNPNPAETIDSDSADLLKGLAWMCSLIDEDARLARALGDAAEDSFKKVTNLGPRCPKLGNACVGALSTLKSKEAIAQLGRLKARVKHASTRNTIEKGLGNAAKKAGMSVQDLEELNVPDYGFTEIGKLVQDFETHKAQIIIDGSDVELKWFDANGKEQKSVPTKIKTDNAADVKTLKKTVSDVEKLLLAIRHRIETSLINQRSWKFKDLKERYLDHPIAATVARRLIWSISGKGAIFNDGQMVDVQNVTVHAPDDAHVELWHPITCEPEEVLSWRNWLRGHEITQPFKQAHREIYVLTDAERATETYSNRFAAHVIRQHQFAQLCQQRGWKYTLQGGWDSHNTPYLELPKWDLVAQYFVDANPDTNAMSPSAVFLNCITDQVRFHRTDGALIPLSEVMPIVFTEVMRDVDLFVGVCSIGNDPNWVDAGIGHHEYWQAYSFGDLSATAETRKEVLQEILPALKIKSRCKIEGKFLFVEGEIRTYKIHLGSGNILMEPNDEYLCIVPDRGIKSGGMTKVFLPFEGDSVLSVILSKAFMLVEDKKIKDPTIISQLKRGL